MRGKSAEKAPKVRTRGGRRKARRRALTYGMLPELVGYNLRRAQLAVFQDFAGSLSGFDITPAQIGALTIIAANPGLNQSELGHALGIDRSTVVAVIDRLEDRGLVRRVPSPSDRRSYELRMSRAGRGLLAKVRPLLRQHEQRIAEPLSAAEKATLIALLRRIAGPEWHGRAAKRGGSAQ